MSARLSSAEVYDEAAFWAAKLDAGSLTEEERTALDSWLAVDTRHCGAMMQACALLVSQNEVSPAWAPKPEQPEQPARRRLLIGGGIAAGVLAVLGGTHYAARFFGEDRYRTTVGEMRAVALKDGSVAFLNTNTEIRVRYSSDRRDIALVQGEALFNVAKNDQAPFIVQVDSAQIRAVGTSFNVKALPRLPVKVLVREGVVEVRRSNVPVAPAIRVAENNQVIVPQAAPIVANPVSVVELGRELAWQVGRIAFNGETLSQAAAEFARYSDIHIQIDDPELANETVTGLFVSTDPIGFASALAISFNLRTQIGKNKIQLLRD